MNWWVVFWLFMVCYSVTNIGHFDGKEGLGALIFAHLMLMGSCIGLAWVLG